MVGGSLLLGSIRDMMGGAAAIRPSPTPAHPATAAKARVPWSDQSGSDLARDAGINDIGSSGRRADDNSGSRAGFFDQASNDDDYNDVDHDSDGFRR